MRINCRKIDVYCSFKFLQLPFDNDEECRAINVDETSPPPSEQYESLVIFLLISCSFVNEERAIILHDHNNLFSKAFRFG